MNIAVYISSQNPRSNFIVGTFFPLFKQLQDHRFLIITDSKDELTANSNFEMIKIKPQPKNGLLKKFWIERTLTNVLKKMKPDIFISADNFCMLNAFLPQYILMPDPDRIKPAYLKKAQLLIVGSEIEKSKLIELNVPDNKIEVVYPPINKLFSPIDSEKRELIKNKYSEGKEYFLCSNKIRKQEDLVNLLKAFSHFKKRQQSSFKLLLLKEPFLEKIIENYKYRHDISIIDPKNVEEAAAITTGAYALILPFVTNEDIASALNAMNAAVPVITQKNSSINEIAGDEVMYAEADIKDMGEKMMQLYKDEALRSELMEKGKERVKNFTLERSADQLWQTISKALN